MSDDLNPATKALVASARRSGRTLEPRRRVQLRSGVVAAVASSTLAAAASISMGKLVLVGAISAALGSGVTLLAVQVTKAPVVPSAAPLVAPPTAPPKGTTQVAKPVPAPQSVEVTPAPTPPPLAVVPARTPAAAPSSPETPPVSAGVVRSPPPSPAGLAAELELIRGVMAATQAQRWVEAQRLLDEHQHRFDSPQLKSEARAMQVVVWCAAGRVDEARQLARELERTDALNPAVQRLHTSCAW